MRSMKVEPIRIILQRYLSNSILGRKEGTAKPDAFSITAAVLATTANSWRGVAGR